MQNNDTLNILYETQGCFSFNWGTAKIIKKNDGYLIYYMNKNGWNEFLFEGNGTYDAIKNIELFGLNKISTTTITTYTFEYKNQIKKVLCNGGSSLPLYFGKRF